MEIGIIRASKEEIDRIRDHLGDPSFNPDTLCLFRKPQRKGTYRPPLVVRRKPAKSSPDKENDFPLFGGHLRFGSYVGPGKRTSELSFSLDVNLALLARLQEDDCISPLVFGPKAKPCSSGEISLDGKHNWLKSGTQDEIFTPERWKQFVWDAVANIRKAVIETLKGVCRDIAPQAAFLEQGTSFIESTESYWEFSSQNPIALIRDISGPLGDFCRKYQTTFYPFASDIQHCMEGNCPSLKLELGKGVFLRIYAKTGERIRWEIVHELKKNADVLGQKSGETGKITTSRAAKSKERFLEMLHILGKDAASIINQALAHLEQKTDIEPSGINQFALVAKIGAVVRDPEIAVTVMEILRTRGSIDSKNIPKNLKDAVNALKKGGILQGANNKSKLYRICPEYQYALKGLMNYPDSLLSAPSASLASSPSMLAEAAA